MDRKKPMDGEMLRVMQQFQLSLLKMVVPEVMVQKLVVLMMQLLMEARRDSMVKPLLLFDKVRRFYNNLINSINFTIEFITARSRCLSF